MYGICREIFKVLKIKGHLDHIPALNRPEIWASKHLQVQNFHITVLGSSVYIEKFIPLIALVFIDMSKMNGMHFFKLFICKIQKGI
jgi:hypothetical protein